MRLLTLLASPPRPPSTRPFPPSHLTSLPASQPLSSLRSGGAEDPARMPLTPPHLSDPCCRSCIL
ncbi:hypothetical protein K505DRAFT_320531 [Melanomma pulvis-pyrius CBS 109.77]|uniref:Uncharacterized protein n=1 Tax=Melanomma pulvis-pyrius CBS 109.77 TaxID=1314802 RepID=A0A6A6XV41_9PLEO|nr:hypothetical protein K505DRAFT_320531 [Melanomma pulvis-pyrius CBS 109.77]